MNNKIRGVVVDAGHGGVDGGASANGLLEKDLTLKISTYIYNRLKELGIPVKMTRTTDETLPANERVPRVLNAFGNYPDVIVLSNHINAGGGDGAEVVYALRNNDTLANMVLNELGNKGQNKRKVYQKRLPSDTSKDYYYILRETGKTQPLLIEYGFIDSKGDDVNLLKNNILDLAEGTVKAVTEYIGVPYTPPVTNQDTYTVQKGDTLYSISKRFNISIEDLIRINNLSNNILSIGQVLYLNDNNKEYDTYIVQKGDSLWKISREYNIPVNQLIEINNLNNTIISIGQKLLVPKQDKKVNETYTVQKGDTLWNIAKRYNMSVYELKELNNLTSNILSIGQILNIKKF